MKAALKGCCKSEDNAYIGVVVRDVASAADLEVSVVSRSGCAIPYECQILDVDESTGTIELVVRSAFVHAGSISVVMEERPNAAESECATLAIDMTRLKWESRFNYRLRKDLAWRIRNAADDNVYERINFEMHDAFDDGDDVIVRGTAWFPAGDYPVVFQCYDENGDLSDVAPLLASDSIRESRTVSSFSIREISFSLRVPISQRAFTISAKDASGCVLDGFYTLSGLSLNRLRGETLERIADASCDSGYPEWLSRRQASYIQLKKQSLLACELSARFVIVVPIDGADVEMLVRTIASVQSQSAQLWKLLFADPACSANQPARIREFIDGDDRISLWRFDGEKDNREIASLFDENAYALVIEPGMTLEPDALFELAKAIEASPDADVLYSDEDVMTAPGKNEMPFFKPDFNLGLLRSYNYIGRMLCVRASLFETPSLLIQGANDGARAYRLALRASELTTAIKHIPRIMVHESDAKAGAAGNYGVCDAGDSTARDAFANALKSHFDRLEIQADVSPGKWRSVQNVRYAVKGSPLVSVIIPSKDHHEMLERCIESILCKTAYSNFEVIVIENNSVEEATFAYYDTVQRENGRVRVIEWEGEFNYSKIVNFGVRHSKGDYYLLLNNDTEVIEPDWMGAMLGACQQSDVGAVGARLFYADGSIQHAGALITDSSSGAHHAFMALPGSYPGYYLQAVVAKDCSIVTAACMLTSREAFEIVEGFSEELAVAYNDVDYCLKLRDRGLRVVYEPAAELYHYESASRGYDALDFDKQVRLYREEAYIHSKWAHVYVEGDPFFNPNLETFYYKLRTV